MRNTTQGVTPKCFSGVIGHQIFEDALQRLLELESQRSSTRIVIVTGPTGSGKTTLRERFALELQARAAPEIQGNPEMVAYGGCAIKARGGAVFSWKDPYIQLLRSLQHPFPDTRLAAQGKTSPETTDQSLKGFSPDVARRFTNDRLFRMLQKTIDHRKPRAILLDEAHHFLRVGSSMTLVDQLEHIKFIADETRTLFVLFGTYELIKLMDLSGPLIRRREVVHLPRYTYDPQHPQPSLEAFAKVVAVFTRDLEDDCEITLLREVPYLYQGSVGCVGILRDWLYRAYVRAKDSKGHRITKKILKDTEFAVSDRNQLLTEALNGEEYFGKRALDEDKYLARLGFTHQGGSSTTKDDRNERKGRHKPGERNPHNDQTGVSSLDPNKEKAA